MRARRQRARRRRRRPRPRGAAPARRSRSGSTVSLRWRPSRPTATSRGRRGAPARRSPRPGRSQVRRAQARRGPPTWRGRGRRLATPSHASAAVWNGAPTPAGMSCTSKAKPGPSSGSARSQRPALPPVRAPTTSSEWSRQQPATRSDSARAWSRSAQCRCWSMSRMTSSHRLSISPRRSSGRSRTFCAITLRASGARAHEVIRKPIQRGGVRRRRVGRSRALAENPLNVRPPSRLSNSPVGVPGGDPPAPGQRGRRGGPAVAAVRRAGRCGDLVPSTTP
jgi:hypothetical protein